MGSDYGAYGIFAFAGQIDGIAGGTTGPGAHHPATAPIAISERVVVSTTEHERDEVIRECARQQGASVFAGSEEDVLSRVLAASRSVGADTITLITGDCPLIDAAVSDRVVEAYLQQKPDYCSNSLPPASYPAGFETEVFSVDVLADVDRRAFSPADREHVTLHIYQHPETYQLLRVAAPPEHYWPDPELVLVIDTEEDYRLVSAVYEYLFPRKANFGIDEVMAFLRGRPDLVALNWGGEISRGPDRPVLRAGIIGCGDIGSHADEQWRGGYPRTHCGAYATRKDVQVVALAEPNTERRMAAQHFWNVPAAYSDHREMLRREEFDIVSICTPVESHANIIRDAVAAGAKVLWCEKPLCEGAAQGIEVARFCEAQSVPLVLNYLRRFTELYQDLRRFLRYGAIGQVQRVSVHYMRGLANNASHAIDIVRFLLGEIRSVVAWDVLHERERDASIDAHLFTDSGCVVSLSAHDRNAYEVFELTFWGTKGRVELKSFGGFPVVYQAAPLAGHPGYFDLAQVETKLPRGIHDAWLNAVENVVQCARGQATPICGAADGIAALRIVDAIRQSAIRKCPVEVLPDTTFAEC
jgi:spore coat polysaccharide biosynthesis protein SpsF